MPGQICPLVTTKYLTRRLFWKCRGVCCSINWDRIPEMGEFFVSSKISWTFTPVWFSLCHGAIVLDEPHLLAWFPQAWKSILCLRNLNHKKATEFPCQNSTEMLPTSWRMLTGWMAFLISEGRQMVGARKSKESHSFLFDWINIKYLLWGKCCTQSRG